MGRKGIKRGRTKTRARKRDLDEIIKDLEPDKAASLLSQAVDEDKPGLAQHYCIECARYFVTAAMLVAHKRGKPHKRRVKCLAEPEYTQEEADRAGGLGREEKKSDKNSNEMIVDK